MVGIRSRGMGVIWRFEKRGEWVWEKGRVAVMYY